MTSTIIIRRKHADGSVTDCDQPSLEIALTNCKDGWFLATADPNMVAGENKAELSKLIERQAATESVLLNVTSALTRLLDRMDGNTAATAPAPTPAVAPPPAPVAPPPPVLVAAPAPAAVAAPTEPSAVEVKLLARLEAMEEHAQVSSAVLKELAAQLTDLKKNAAPAPKGKKGEEKTPDAGPERSFGGGEK